MVENRKCYYTAKFIIFFKEKSSGFPPEIIEFPVLLVDLVTGETGGYFGFICLFFK